MLAMEDKESKVCALLMVRGMQSMAAWDRPAFSMGGMTAWLDEMLIRLMQVSEASADSSNRAASGHQQTMHASRSEQMTHAPTTLALRACKASRRAWLRAGYM